MYPVTIIKTRYGGAYEGGQWAAFNCYPEAIPWQATDDDNTCSQWWFDTRNSASVGIGSNATEAYEDLIARNR